MPKENTHLYFAKRLLNSHTGKDILSPVKQSEKAFFLGSILPDSYYYHPQKDIATISDRLHGRDEKAGGMIVSFLRAAKKQHSVQDYALALGYISHWSLDKIFHPIIEHLCGDNHDPDSLKRMNSVCCHRLLETELDRRVNTGCYVHEMIDLNMLSRLNAVRMLTERTGASENELRRALARQKRLNRMMMRKWAYMWARVLKLMGKKGMNEILPLFYEHLKIQRETFPDAVYDESAEKYRSVEDLFQAAEAFARSVFEPAYGFLQGPSGDAVSYLEEIECLLTGSV